MAEVGFFKMYGPWVDAGRTSYRVLTCITADVDVSDMYTLKGSIKVGYETKNLASGTTINGSLLLSNSQGKQLTLRKINPSPSGGSFYSGLDVDFQQDYNTTLNISCACSRKNAGVMQDESTLNKTITLYPPCARNWDELNLTVNGTKITRNCQIVEVDSIDDEVEISADCYAAFAFKKPNLSLYSIGYTGDEPPAPVTVEGTQVAYEDDEPRKQRLTIRASVFDLLENFFRNAANEGLYTMKSYDCKASQYNVSTGESYSIEAFGDLPEVDLVGQFKDGGKLGCGCVCFTVSQSSQSGADSVGFMYARSGNSTTFGNKGPSFVLYVGPFVQYKDDVGIVQKAKIAVGIDSSESPFGTNALLSLYEGQCKDANGVVHTF